MNDFQKFLDEKLESIQLDNGLSMGILLIPMIFIRRFVMQLLHSGTIIT